MVEVILPPLQRSRARRVCVFCVLLLSFPFLFLAVLPLQYGLTLTLDCALFGCHKAVTDQRLTRFRPLGG